MTSTYRKKWLFACLRKAGISASGGAFRQAVLADIAIFSIAEMLDDDPDQI